MLSTSTREAIQYIAQRAKKEQLQNIQTILSEPDNPQLPAASIDAVLLLKTYHEVAHPVVLLKEPSLVPLNQEPKLVPSS